MFSSPVDYQKPNPRRLPFRFRRYLNTGILAFAIIIAIAILVTTRGKEPEANQPRVPEARQFIAKVISAFNDPSLIDYANQQGPDIPGSATLLNNSSQSLVPSRSPSGRSSASY
jgi:hypothetical protein